MFDAEDREFVAMWAIRISGVGLALVAGCGFVGLAMGVGIRAFELVTR